MTNSALQPRSDSDPPPANADSGDALAAGLWSADGIAMRLVFFGPEPRQISLRTARDFLNSQGKGSIAEKLTKSVRSMHQDIVTPPFANNDKLPLFVMCEPFGADDDGNPVGDFVRKVGIVIPPVLAMAWEGRRSEMNFGSTQRIGATLVNSFCIFESGYFAYSVSFVFNTMDGKTALPKASLLALASAWGESAGERDPGEDVLIGFDGEEKCTLLSFLGKRLATLSNKTGPGAEFSVFSVLQKGGNAPKEILPLREAMSGLLQSARTRPTSIDIEIIGSSEQKAVLDCSKDAENRKAKTDTFSKMLAGLAQNIFDFDEQDDEEINNSLSSRALIGEDVSFANRGIAIRFRASSRPYRLKKFEVGGSPYWMLVQLVAGHNKILLTHLFESERSLGDRLNKTIVSRRISAGNLDATLRQKMQTGLYISDIFRYHTDSEQYRLLAKAWDLDAQYRILQGKQDVRDLKIRHDEEQLKERESIRLNGGILALAILQLGGVGASVAAIPDSVPKYWAWIFGTVPTAIAIILFAWSYLRANRVGTSEPLKRSRRGGSDGS